MKINCLSCGHKIELDAAYDDYEGEIKCYACGGLLKIKTDSGSVKSVRFASMSAPDPLNEMKMLERSHR